MNTNNTKIVSDKNTTICWKLAQTHPILAFLLITFAWSWLFWFAAIPLRGQDTLLRTVIVFIGGYGPAIGGILALGLKNGMRFKLNQKQLPAMLLGAGLIFGLMVLRYLIGNIPNYDRLPENLALTAPIVIAAVAASLVGGWVIASAYANNMDVRGKMGSLIPSHLPLGWTLLALFFFAGLLLVSWGLAALLGMEIEYPGLWGRPALEIIPLFLLAFTLTALARGGMEEPGWRGMMQPELQTRFSPLAASLVVSGFWSLWHLPLFLNRFYPEDLVMGMIGGGIYRILLAIFMAWFYNRSGGKVILLVILHTSFNMVVNYIPVSEPLLVVLWLIVVVTVVLKDKMYRKLPSSL